MSQKQYTMKPLFTSLLLLITSLTFLTAQDFYLPVSTSSKEAKNAYHAALYLGSNLRLDAARQEIEKALALDPGFFMAHAYRIQVLTADEEKLPLIRRALEINPADFTEFERILRGLLSTWSQDLKASPATAMQALVAAYPTTVEAYEWAYMHAAYTDQDPDAAMAYAQRLIELDPNFPPVYNYLGYFYLERKELDSAQAAFEKYLEPAPAEPNAHDSMGEYYFITEDYAKSAEYYERAAALGMRESQARADRARAKIKK